MIGAEASVDGMASAYRELLSAGSELVLAAGATGTDPFDIVFEGLRRAGGEVEQIGIPADRAPRAGSVTWAPCPVLGLASCELFGRPGALDLLLPRLFTARPWIERCYAAWPQAGCCMVHLELRRITRARALPATRLCVGLLEPLRCGDQLRQLDEQRAQGSAIGLGQAHRLDAVDGAGDLTERLRVISETAIAITETPYAGARRVAQFDSNHV